MSKHKLIYVYSPRDQSPDSKNKHGEHNGRNEKSQHKNDSKKGTSENESLEIEPFELTQKVKEKKISDEELLLLQNRIKRLELEEERARKRINEAKK